MNNKPISKTKAYMFVVFLIALFIVYTIGNYANGQESEGQENGLQDCSQPHTRSGKNPGRFLQFTGQCHVETNSRGEPMYEYYQYQICRKSYDSHAYGQSRRPTTKCLADYWYEQRSHPKHRRGGARYGWERQRDERFPAYGGTTNE